MRVALLFLLVALTCASACGGDDGGRPPMTPQEYFAQVQAADDQASARFQQIGAQLDEAQSDTEALRTLRDVYPQQVATLRDLADQLDALRPPDEVQDEHEAAVDALNESIEVTQESSREIRNAARLEQVSTFLARQEVVDADQRVNETCLALEAAGTQLGITVDLDC